MKIFGPSPRYRLYTKSGNYISFIFDSLAGLLNKGNDTSLLEEELSRFLAVDNVLMVSMCRSGIYQAVKSLVTPGREVIMSPYTIADVVNMVILAGGVPVFADIEEDSCNINPEEVEKLIHKDTGAVLVTHLHGLAAKIREIKSICDSFNVPVIEDAAQAFGCSINGQYAGTIGDVGVYSFGTYKNVNAWYGGAIVSNNAQIIDKVRKNCADYPSQSVSMLARRIMKGLVSDILTSSVVFRLFVFHVFRYGFLNDINWINKYVTSELDLSLKIEMPASYLVKPTDYQARLVRQQLPMVAQYSTERIKRAEIYRNGLSGIDGVIIPPAVQEFEHIYTYFPVRYKNRHSLLKEIMKRYRDVGAQHLKNCAGLPAFSAYHRSCPVAAAVANELILLPTYPDYPEQEARQTLEVLQEILTRPIK